MKRTMLLLALLVLLLTGCRTSEAVEEETIDIKPSMEILFDSRPDNSTLKIVEVKTVDDIVTNSATYLMAWELWETYADSLEAYIQKVSDLL